jgi:hypothetical protein
MSVAFPPLYPEYDEFLYAIVRSETNGMQLTMASAIARSGADPWKEAARISRLPKHAALGALAGLVPDLPAEHDAADSQLTAGRLFSLLPKRGPVLAARKPDANPVKPAAAVFILALCVIATIFVSLLVTAPRHEGKSQANVLAASAPAEETAQ